MKSGRPVLILSALGSLLFVTLIYAQSDVSYIAETIAPARMTGAVVAAKVKWECQGSACKTFAPAPLNQLEMCRDLARQVGALKSYQHGSEVMAASDLQQCNAADAQKPVLVRPAVVAAVKPVMPMQVAQPRPATPVAAASVATSVSVPQFRAMSSALAASLRPTVPDLDAYLAASRSYVESPANHTAAFAQSVNARFAGPIHAALSKSVGDEALAQLLQSAQSGGTTAECSTVETAAASCCSTQRFTPPFDGLFREGDNGARTVVPGPVAKLFPRVRGWGAWAPHSLERSGLTITVPDNARHVIVTETLDTAWIIGLSGVGYAHVWLGLDMDVRRGDSVRCATTHIEQDNRWTWAGGTLPAFEQRPGPRITRSCEFDRAEGDPTEYTVNVTARADGTFAGMSGGFGDYEVQLGPVDVTSCP